MKKRMTIPVTKVSITYDGQKTDHILGSEAFIINKDGSICLARARDSPNNVDDSVAIKENDFLHTSFLNWYLNFLHLDKGKERFR